MSYISRQALLEKLEYMGDFNIGIDYVTAEDIMSVPSADVRENVHGEWKRISPAGIYECSCCGQNVMTSDIECYKFCHGCGADMRKGET